MDLVEIFKVINTPSRSTPDLVKKVTDYLLNLIGAGTGNDDGLAIRNKHPLSASGLPRDFSFLIERIC